MIVGHAVIVISAIDADIATPAHHISPTHVLKATSIKRTLDIAPTRSEGDEPGPIGAHRLNSPFAARAAANCVPTIIADRGHAAAGIHSCRSAAGRCDGCCAPIPVAFDDGTVGSSDPRRSAFGTVRPWTLSSVASLGIRWSSELAPWIRGAAV